ncbi:hypothetical protein HanRHA438_Chr02g0056921 [Helianthus annuus]|nr:hypothetical protein HanRHA438_Chr02g0056921 [Helianthus annuus]
MPSRRFLGSSAISGNWLSMACHAGESDGWRKTPGFLELVACHNKSFAILLA